MINKCIDCKECNDILIHRYQCKLNYTIRLPTDTCCWNSKRYPSKFKSKDPAIQMATKLIDKTEIGALKQWLRDNIEYEDGEPISISSIRKMCYKDVLEYLERGDE